MTRLRVPAACFALCLAFPAVTTFEQYREGSPEAAIVALFRAMYANDVPEFERLTMPHPERSRLTTGGKANEERLRSLTDNPGSLQIKLKREFQLKGQAATPDSRGWYPSARPCATQRLTRVRR